MEIIIPDEQPVESNSMNEINEMILKIEEAFSKIFIKTEDSPEEYYKQLFQIYQSQELKIEDILKAPAIIAITSDIDLITHCIFNSKHLKVVDGLVRSIHYKKEQKTLLLFNISSNASSEEILSIFNSSNAPTPMNTRAENNDTWYVTFNSEEEAKVAKIAIANAKYLDKKISSRLKTELTISSSMRSSNTPYNSINSNNSFSPVAGVISIDQSGSTTAASESSNVEPVASKNNAALDENGQSLPFNQSRNISNNNNAPVNPIGNMFYNGYHPMGAGPQSQLLYPGVPSPLPPQHMMYPPPPAYMNMVPNGYNHPNSQQQQQYQPSQQQLGGVPLVAVNSNNNNYPNNHRSNKYNGNNQYTSGRGYNQQRVKGQQGGGGYLGNKANIYNNSLPPMPFFPMPFVVPPPLPHQIQQQLPISSESINTDTTATTTTLNDANIVEGNINITSIEDEGASEVSSNEKKEGETTSINPTDNDDNSSTQNQQHNDPSSTVPMMNSLQHQLSPMDFMQYQQAAAYSMNNPFFDPYLMNGYPPYPTMLGGPSSMMMNPMQQQQMMMMMMDPRVMNGMLPSVPPPPPTSINSTNSHMTVQGIVNNPDTTSLVEISGAVQDHSKQITSANDSNHHLANSNSLQSSSYSKSKPKQSNQQGGPNYKNSIGNNPIPSGKVQNSTNNRPVSNYVKGSNLESNTNNPNASTVGDISNYISDTSNPSNNRKTLQNKGNDNKSSFTGNKENSQTKISKPSNSGTGVGSIANKQPIKKAAIEFNFEADFPTLLTDGDNSDKPKSTSISNNIQIQHKDGYANAVKKLQLVAAATENNHLPTTTSSIAISSNSNNSDIIVSTDITKNDNKIENSNTNMNNKNKNKKKDGKIMNKDTKTDKKLIDIQQQQQQQYSVTDDNDGNDDKLLPITFGSFDIQTLESLSQSTLDNNNNNNSSIQLIQSNKVILPQQPSQILPITPTVQSQSSTSVNISDDINSNNNMASKKSFLDALRR